MADTDYSVYTGSWVYSNNAGTPVILYRTKTTTTIEVYGRWNGTGQSGVKGYWVVCGKAAS